jgi:hypothetical protein
MEPNFAAFQLIGQIALGIIAFSQSSLSISLNQYMIGWPNVKNNIKATPKQFTE